MARIAEHARKHTETLLNHPYQRYCGIEIIEQKPGYCRCRLQVTEAIANLSRNLHGGVLYSMLDVTSMLATLPILGTDEYAVTNSISVSVMSAVPAGAILEMEASVERAGRNLIFTQCQAWKLLNGDKRQAASAQLSKFRMGYTWESLGGRRPEASAAA